ncbi:MAG TPA: AAA family ATPase [Solirubrobacteraceae bacterium]
MSRAAQMPEGRALLEREAELARGEAAFALAATGRGAMVAIEGPAGAGKTALLGALETRAQAAGVDVRVARATELERDFAFGGARQLLSGPGSAAAIASNGGGRAALPVLAPSDTAVSPPPAFAALDGLTAVLRALSAAGMVALLIDDAHWLDAPTLRWLDYLRGRVDQLPVLVVLAVRETAARNMHGPLDRVLADPRVDLWALPPLSEAAVGALLGARLGRSPEPALVAGCVRATAGNAFAVSELIAALDLGDADPPDAVARLTQRVPGTIARSIRGRLSRLDPDAVAVAKALAVLGDGAPLHRVAALAGLAPERASPAADRLAAADLMVASRPLAFVHPLVRSAIEGDLAPGARAQLHATAAGRLAGEDADPEAIAAHLLRTDPVGSVETVRRLRDAATVALRRGAPDTAAVYLGRAYAEPPPAGERIEVLHALGRAELLARAPAGEEHLRSALDRATDPVTRARIGVDLFDGMTFGGRWREALRLIHALRNELGDREPDTALALEMRFALGLIEHDAGPDSGELQRVEALATSAPGARPLLLLVALVLALRGERCDEVPGLVADGLDGPRFLAEHSADSMLAVHGVDALVFVDDLPAAQTLAEAVCEDARRRGLVLGAVAGSTHRGLVALRRGALVEAERDLRDALTIAREHELHFTLPFVCGYLGQALADQGRLADTTAVLESVPPGALEFANPAAATLLGVRGTVRLAGGDRATAIADLRACGTHMSQMGAANPVVEPWRSTLALALGPEGRDEADELLAQELALARRAGIPRGVGVALRAQAQLSTGDRTIRLLEEAIDVLTDSPATLERARALADLGAALRRSGHVHAARARLRDALDRASRCGAAGLAADITSELHIAGARPRGPWLSGVPSLTPSELRVARLASRGLTNNEIAAELVITTKTVKHHLGAVYRKLNIATRRELDATALAANRAQPGFNER